MGKSLAVALVLCGPPGFLDYLVGLVLNPFILSKKLFQLMHPHLYSHYNINVRDAAFNLKSLMV